MATQQVCYVSSNSALHFLASNWSYISSRYTELQQVYTTYDGVLRSDGWHRYMGELSNNESRRQVVATLVSRSPLTNVAFGEPYPSDRVWELGTVVPCEMVRRAWSGKWHAYGAVDLLRARAFLTLVLETVRSRLEASGRQQPENSALFDTITTDLTLREFTLMREPPKHKCIVNEAEEVEFTGNYDLNFWLRLLTGSGVPPTLNDTLQYATDMYLNDPRHNPFASARLMADHDSRLLIWIPLRESMRVLVNNVALLDDVHRVYQEFMSTVRLVQQLPGVLADTVKERYPIGKPKPTTTTTAP